MATASADTSATQPNWTDFTVMVFHGQSDTHIRTGEDYATRTLGELFAMPPGAEDKGAGLAFIPSSYADHDGRAHAAQQARGSFVALTGDIDSGDHALNAVRDAVRAFAGDCAWLIYTSAHARPGDMRWRVLLPLQSPASFAEWHDAQCAFFDYMDASGFFMDRALARAGQPVYAPNVPAKHAKSKTDLRGVDGKPLYFRRASSGTDRPGLCLTAGNVAIGIAAIRRKRIADDRERELIRREAEQRRASKPRGDGANIIDDFNAENSVAKMLKICGYDQSPRHPEDWRSPQQTGTTFATRVIGSKWVSLSQSDAGSGLGETCQSGCYGDAYDLFVHYKHGGDHKAAFRALHAERRAANQNVVYPPQFDPPEWMNEIPSYDEAPEWSGGDEIDVAPEHAQPGTRLPVIWFADAEPNLDANDFVEGLLTAGSMSVVYGQSNCGKTFFIIDLALHVAWGREWRGRAVDRGAIVYLSLEGAQGVRNRMSAFRKHHELTDPLPFVAMPKPISLLDSEADVQAVIDLSHHIAAQTQMHVAMVIVDTLSRAMAGGNENSPEDMTALIGNCDRIRDATGAHVCIVHHSGKDDARGARGHSSLRAATDTEIEIKRDPEMTFSSVRIAKQRDLEAADPFAFTLQSIALGINRRGKAVTSCVVIEAEQATVLARDPNKLSPKEEDALSALDYCIMSQGRQTETSRNGEHVSGVELAAWRRSLHAHNITDRNNRDAARAQFSRIKKSLENKGFIETGGDMVWRAKHAET